MVDKRIRGDTNGATKDMSIRHPKDGEGLTDKQKIFVKILGKDVFSKLYFGGRGH